MFNHIRSLVSVEDVRAGWVDARRTISPRVTTGLRLGGLDYAAGYAAGALVHFGGAR